jgi:hypothetical protein
LTATVTFCYHLGVHSKKGCCMNAALMAVAIPDHRTYELDLGRSTADLYEQQDGERRYVATVYGPDAARRLIDRLGRGITGEDIAVAQDLHDAGYTGERLEKLARAVVDVPVEVLAVLTAWYRDQVRAPARLDEALAELNLAHVHACASGDQS